MYDFFEVVKERTSYRGDYYGERIPRGDLVKIMEAGLAAPSGCNQQTTSLIAVDDDELLKQIKSLFLRPIAMSAPAFICVLTKETPTFKGKSYHVQDYSAAIQNMLLAIKALGYDSCWYEGYMTDEHHIGDQVAKVLGVPEDMELVCILPVGVASQGTRAVDKKPFEERAWFNGYENRK